MGERRGVNSAVGSILLVGIVIVLGIAIAAFTLGLGSDLEEPGPYSGVSSDAELVTSGNGSCDEAVRLTHSGGDPVDVSGMEMIVRLRGGEYEATITNLPTDGKSFDDEHIEGDTDLIDEGGCVRGALREEKWESGTSLEFRVNHGAPDPQSGDELEIVVVDRESRAIVTEETLTF